MKLIKLITVAITDEGDDIEKSLIQRSRSARDDRKNRERHGS